MTLWRPAVVTVSLLILAPAFLAFGVALGAWSGLVRAAAEVGAIVVDVWEKRA